VNTRNKFVSEITFESPTIDEFDSDHVEDLIKMANHDIDLYKHGLFKQNSLTNILYYTLYNYYYYKYKEVKGGEITAFNLFNQHLNKLISRHGWTVAEYIVKKRTFTKKEIIYETGVNQQSVNQHVNNFLDMGLIYAIGKVKPPYTMKDCRPSITYSLSATPSSEEVTEAQRRYAILTMGYDPREKHRKIIEQEKIILQKESVREEELKELGQQCLNQFEGDKHGQIYDFMNANGLMDKFERDFVYYYVVDKLEELARKRLMETAQND
jgi:hypothetical protein